MYIFKKRIPNNKVSTLAGIIICSKFIYFFSETFQWFTFKSFAVVSGLVV